jgi:hypothetical protein
MYKDTRIDKELPQILEFLERWELVATVLRIIHLILGTLAVFFSLLAASQIGSIQDEYAKILAFIAAVSIALLAAFNLSEKSNNVRNAWRELNAAVMKFNENIIDEKEIIEKYREAERIVGDVTFSRSG